MRTKSMKMNMTDMCYKINMSQIIINTNQSTKLHNHMDTEWLFIESGNGKLIKDGKDIILKPGKLIYLEPFAYHKIINKSKNKLKFTNMWYEEERSENRLLVKKTHARKKRKLNILLPSFITPNGRLHIGHIAGPLLGADICKKYYSLNNNPTILLMGTLGFQTQVEKTAKKKQRHYVDTALYYSKEIKSLIDKFNISYDTFVTLSERTLLENQASNVLNILIQKGYIKHKYIKTLYCQQCATYLFEAHVIGKCYNCHKTSSTECESCGFYNREDILLNPRCVICHKQAKYKSVKRLILNLEMGRKHLIDMCYANYFQGKDRILVNQVLSKKLPEIPVGIIAKTGITLEKYGYPLHVLSSTIELLPRFLTALHKHNTDNQINEKNMYKSSNKIELTLFYGSDNAYLRCIIFSVLLRMYDINMINKIKFYRNDFYCVNNDKFSTSRRNVVDISKLEKYAHIDYLRFYLAYTRPEMHTSHFSVREYQAFIEQYINNKLRIWLTRINYIMKYRYKRFIPERGSWEQKHYDFYYIIMSIKDQIQYYYQKENFSTRMICMLLLSFITCCYENLHCLDIPKKYIENSDGYLRNGICLHLQALIIFCNLAMPIIPTICKNLMTQMNERTNATKMNKHIKWIKAGTKIKTLNIP